MELWPFKKKPPVEEVTAPSAFQIPVEYGVSDQDVYASMFGGNPAAAETALSPKIRLRVKIAEKRAAQLQERREIDKRTLPFIQQDIVESEKRQIDIQKSIDEAMNALKAPPPTQQIGSNDAEIYAAALGGLVLGGNFPEILNALAKVSGARNAQEFDDKLRQYGLSRETVKIGLQHLVSKLDDEAANEKYMRGSNQQAEQFNVNEANEQARFYEGQEFDLDKMEVKRGYDVEDRDAEIKARESLKRLELEAEGPKERRALEERGIDNFGARIARQFPAGHPITAEQAKYVNAEADAFVDNYYERDTPEWFRMREGIGDVLVRDVAPGLQWDKEKYNLEKPQRDLRGKIDNQRLKDMQNKPSPAKKAAEQRVRDLDAKIVAARDKRVALEELGPPSDPDKVETYQRDLDLLRNQEWNAYQKKHGAAAGTKGEYFFGATADKLRGVFGVGNPKKTKTKIHKGWVYEQGSDGNWYPKRKA